MLQGRRVLLCVTGGVAAYKSAYLARRLVEAGATVRVEMTESALEFVGAQTFAAITGEHPFTALFAADLVSPHTELARWADLVIVAPATGATIGRVANGISEDLVSATIIATTVPVLLAPAMHTEMWEHPATERNLETLRGFGYHIIGPEIGPLAGGDTGMGRVAEPEEIIAAAGDILGGEGKGQKVLVTAGGTREPVDPVRYLGNRSTGKMGHAIADAAIRRGYDVTLVTTADLPTPSGGEADPGGDRRGDAGGSRRSGATCGHHGGGGRRLPAESAAESKIPRADGLPSIELTETPDILASVVQRHPRPFTVGFAAETGGVERAIEKARKKDVDLLVYNDVTEPGSGFGTDTNRVVLIDRSGDTEELPLLPKSEVAERLLDRVAAAIGEQG